MLCALALGGSGAPIARPHAVSPQLVMGPEAVPAAVNSPSFGLFTCQVGLTPGQLCYDPYEMRHAYGTDNLISAGYDGTGRTIVIIDAFQSPKITSDVDAFSSFYGLPLSSAFFTQVAPDGLTPVRLHQRGPAQLDRRDHARRGMGARDRARRERRARAVQVRPGLRHPERAQLRDRQQSSATSFR